MPSAQQLMVLMIANWAETCSDLQKRRRVNITEVARRWKNEAYSQIMYGYVFAAVTHWYLHISPDVCQWSNV
jgi:hypothetical protein